MTEYEPEERQDRYARAIIGLRVREPVRPPLGILARADEFRSFTGPERMDYARAVAWVARHPEDAP